MLMLMLMLILMMPMYDIASSNDFVDRFTVSPFHRLCRCMRSCRQVVSEEGAVSGLLNIAKCLYDAIHRLEKKAAKAEEQEQGGMSAEKQELAASLLKVRDSRKYTSCDVASACRSTSRHAVSVKFLCMPSPGSVVYSFAFLACAV